MGEVFEAPTKLKASRRVKKVGFSDAKSMRK
jgi:hypothetical protein